MYQSSLLLLRQVFEIWVRIPLISDPYHSPLQQAFLADSFALAYGPHGMARFAYPLYPQQTDPQCEVCRGQTATSVRSARTRCFRSRLYPGLCLCGRMEIGYTDILSELVWDRQSLSV
jgi:hypothetical protein